MKKLISVVSTILVAASSAFAQMSSTLYFMEKNPLLNNLNPSFQPEDKMYIGVPALSLISVNAGNNKLTFDDVYVPRYIDGKNTTVLFLHPAAQGEVYNVLNKIGQRDRIFADYNIQLLSFGMRIKEKSYVSFSLNNKADINVCIPRQVLKSALLSSERGLDDKYAFGLSKLSVSANVYSEVALGYSYQFSEYLTVGAKLKYLYGHAGVRTDLKDVDLTISKDEWTFTGDGGVDAAIPGIIINKDEEGKFKDVSFDDNASASDLAKSSGAGVAMDLGITFQPWRYLKFTGSIVDLGFIHWSKNLHSLKKKNDFVYNGITYDIHDRDTADVWAPYEDMLNDMYVVDEGNESFNSMLTCKAFVGAEYSFLENKMSIGALSKTYFYHGAASEEFMMSYNYRPNRIVSASLSYSLTEGEFSNLGLGLNFNLGPVNLFMAMDQIPLRYAKGDGIMVPTRTRYVTYSSGMNIVLRDKERERINELSWKDSDNDGVSDLHDICPDTPENIEVDAKGCPRDSDGDGVPDYMDQCYDSLSGKKVDANGCPLDTDGDGVFDYKDHCNNPNTGNLVDEFGCPSDTDGDGVPDYLDKCDNTPIGAPVDANGCPKDSDNDGVADYLDKCPDTPADTKVDDNGCPFDTTPAIAAPTEVKEESAPAKEESKTSNSKTKPGKNVKIFDKSMIADRENDLTDEEYAANRPQARHYTVVENGVEYDVFESPNCNILFDSSMAVVRNRMLPPIAKVANTLKKNPNTSVIIWGHTDSDCTNEKNLALSVKRAQAVKRVFISKGIEESRVVARGFGETKPIISNRTSIGRSQNRRAEIILVTKTPKSSTKTPAKTNEKSTTKKK